MFSLFDRINLKREVFMSQLFSFLVKPRQYLDPGSGSLIIQIVLGVVLGAGVAIRVFWRNIKNFFTGKKDASDELDPTEIVPDEIENAEPDIAE
jgi:hypothetical protein